MCGLCPSSRQENCVDLSSLNDLANYVSPGCLWIVTESDGTICTSSIGAIDFYRELNIDRPGYISEIFHPTDCASGISTYALFERQVRWGPTHVNIHYIRNAPVASKLGIAAVQRLSTGWNTYMVLLFPLSAVARTVRHEKMSAIQKDYDTMVRIIGHYTVTLEHELAYLSRTLKELRNRKELLSTARKTSGCINVDTHCLQLCELTKNIRTVSKVLKSSSLEQTRSLWTLMSPDRLVMDAIKYCLVEEPIFSKFPTLIRLFIQPGVDKLAGRFMISQFKDSIRTLLENALKHGYTNKASQECPDNIDVYVYRVSDEKESIDGSKESVVRSNVTIGSGISPLDPVKGPESRSSSPTQQPGSRCDVSLIAVEIKDRGNGFPRRNFEQYTQGNRLGARDSGVSGMGLFIASRVCEQIHGGKLVMRVASWPDKDHQTFQIKGSSLIMLLPVAKESERDDFIRSRSARAEKNIDRASTHMTARCLSVYESGCAETTPDMGKYIQPKTYRLPETLCETTSSQRNGGLPFPPHPELSGCAYPRPHLLSERIHSSSVPNANCTQYDETTQAPSESTISTTPQTEKAYFQRERKLVRQHSRTTGEKLTLLSESSHTEEFQCTGAISPPTQEHTDTKHYIPVCPTLNFTTSVTNHTQGESMPLFLRSSLYHNNDIIYMEDQDSARRMGIHMLESLFGKKRRNGGSIRIREYDNAASTFMTDLRQNTLRPFIAVIDYNLGCEPNGLDVAKILCKKYPKIKIVMNTSEDSARFLEHCENAQVDALLPKPTTKEGMAHCMEILGVF